MRQALMLQRVELIQRLSKLDQDVELAEERQLETGLVRMKHLV